MPIVVPRFTVALAAPDIGLEEALDLGEPDGYTVHRVAVMHADQLLAEQAGPRYGLGDDMRKAPVAYTTLWAWAALRRIGVDVEEFPRFKARVLSLEAIKDGDAPAPDTPDDLAGLLDPTRPEVGTSWP